MLIEQFGSLNIFSKFLFEILYYSNLKSDTNELNEIPLAFLFSKIISGNKSENGVPFKFFFQFFKNIILKGLCLTHK